MLETRHFFEACGDKCQPGGAAVSPDPLLLVAMSSPEFTRAFTPPNSTAAVFMSMTPDGVKKAALAFPTKYYVRRQSRSAADQEFGNDVFFEPLLGSSGLITEPLLGRPVESVFYTVALADAAATILDVGFARYNIGYVPAARRSRYGVDYASVSVADQGWTILLSGRFPMGDTSYARIVWSQGGIQDLHMLPTMTDVVQIQVATPPFVGSADIVLRLASGENLTLASVLTCQTEIPATPPPGASAQSRHPHVEPIRPGRPGDDPRTLQ